MIFQPDIETMAYAKLRNLQDERFRKLVKYQYEHQPFYRKKFNEAGIEVNKIRGIGDIEQFPFTIKDDLRDHYPFGLLAVSEDQLTRIHASSGSTGKPTVVGYTRNDIAIFSEVVARSLAAAGAKPGMKLHNAYGYGLFTGGLGLHYGAEKLGMAVIPVSGGGTERQLTILQDFKPEVICCTPSYALTLSEELRKRGIRPDELALKYAVLGAEPWTESIREEVDKGLGVKATNIYGLSEIIGPGVSQEAVDERDGGAYVWEDHFYAEVVDRDTGESLPEGKEGVLVFTTLTKEGMPLTRYWTNDICSLWRDPEGRRSHIKMSRIKGRADDMLIIRGVNLFHTQVEAVLKDLPDFSSHYQLVVTRKDNMDAVEVRVELAEHIYEAKGMKEQLKLDDWLVEKSQLLRKKIKDHVGLKMHISISSWGTVPRSEGGKLSRILDLRE